MTSQSTQRHGRSRRSYQPLLATLAFAQAPLLMMLATHADAAKHTAKPTKAKPVKAKPTKAPSRKPVVAPIVVSNVDTSSITPVSTDATVIPGKAILRTISAQPMAQNNGISLWVYGDNSGATLRVRLAGPEERTALDDTAPIQASWVSSATKIDFVGWHQVLIPKSQFTLEVPEAIQQGVDLTLPPDAQTFSATPTTPDWASIKSITLSIVVPTQSVLTFDDVKYITLDEANKITDSTTIADFETGDVAAWDAMGTRDEKASVIYKVETRPSFVHAGRVALQVSAYSPSYRRKNLLLPTVKQALVATGKNYLIFSPVALTTPILASALPEAGGSSSSLSVNMCADQIQSASFCLYSRAALTDVTASVADDLQGIGHTLPKSAIDLHVVKVWQQLGTSPVRDPNSKVDVPELLVKDDRVPLSGTAPNVRLTGDPVTDIPEGTTKQFWVTVTVPKDFEPGNYTGKILVKAAGLAAPISVPISVNVLNLRLLSPVPQYAINLRSRLDPAPATLPSSDGHALVTDYVSKAILSRQLDNIVSHGFRILTIDDSAATLPDAIAAYQAARVMQPYVYRGDDDPMQIESVRKKNGSPNFLYYVAPEPLSDSTTRLADYNKHGLLGISFMAHQPTIDGLAGNLEVLAYNRDGDYSQTMVRNHGVRTSSKRDWWYWSASNEDPLTNRVSAGFLLWRSHLYGAFIPAYQEAFGTDPYDETSAGAQGGFAAYRPQMLTYPAATGVINTVQWEAVREGVTDARYLTTFYTALRECKDAHIQKALITEAETYVTAFLNKPLDQLSGDDIDAARAKIAGYAVTLRTSVDGYNKKNGL